MLQGSFKEIPEKSGLDYLQKDVKGTGAQPYGLFTPLSPKMLEHWLNSEFRIILFE